MTTLTVGAGQQFATISAAVAASHDGDVLQIQAGTYTNDFATINTKITLEGVGGMVHVDNTGGWDLPGDKGLFVTNTDVTFDHFEISGATSSSGNGAGIRYQAGNLTVLNSYFHNNENGILANPNSTGTVTIKNSEFAFNGNPAGSQGTHNIYIGDIAKVTIDNSYFHDITNEYNQIKSRAAETVITNSRILDLSGNASYEVDIPNGGILTMTNNVIQQSGTSSNPVIVETGAEGVTHAVNSVTMTGNTILNEMAGKGILLNNVANATTTIDGNSIYKVDYLETPSGMTNTTNLSSEPSLNTAHPWDTSTSTSTSTPATIPAAPAESGTLQGGAGDDVLAAPSSGSSWIRGATGDDSITGNTDFNNVNGNQGQDTIIGHSTVGDWLLGGQGNDQIDASQSTGANIINGNMGVDTVTGGSGAETLRGGQGDDVITGGGGNDWISGDMGHNTLTGGAGADIFHASTNAGVQVVTDFSGAEGDRIQLDPGAAFSLSQQGTDLHIVLQNGQGGELVLQHTDQQSFQSSWILGA